MFNAADKVLLQKIIYTTHDKFPDGLKRRFDLWNYFESNKK